MKIVIDTKDIEAFFDTFDDKYDEWWAPTNYMMLYPLIDFLKYAGKDKAVTELNKLLEKN